MNKKEEQIFSRLAHVIEGGNVGFFFGAGMSRNAGVPVVSTIVSKIVSSLALPDHYANIILQLRYPFEAFLELLDRYAPIEHSLKVFNLGEPSEFHLLVKLLVEKGLVKQLMTTNFDLLIEKTNIPELDVVYDEKRFRQLSADKANYIKVHGSVKDIKTIRTLMGTIAKKQMRSKREYAVDFFFNKAGLKTVFVLGYSCSDRLDLTPYIKSAANRDTRVIFVNHTQSDVIKEFQLDKDNPFFGFKSINIECNTDSLIRYLAGYFQASISCNYNHYRIDEYFDYSSLAMYEKCLFGAGLLFRNGNLDDAASLLRFALQHDGDRVFRVEIFSLLLEVYHNIQTIESKPMEVLLPDGVTFEMVEEWKNKALNVLRHINDDKKRHNSVAGLETHWGHFLLSCRRYDEAMRAYQESLGLLLQTSNTYRIYQCYNNFANTEYVRWANDDSALKDDEVYRMCHREWSKCLRYFRQSEYPFEYEISCENMAELLLHFRKNQAKRIEGYLKTAKGLSEYLNDQIGVENCERMMKMVGGRRFLKHRGNYNENEGQTKTIMKYNHPKDVRSPQRYVRKIIPLYDGGDTGISAAILENCDDEVNIGIRWNVSENEWYDKQKINGVKVSVGMPQSRGYSVWFILPDTLWKFVPQMIKDEIKVRHHENLVHIAEEEIQTAIDNIIKDSGLEP